MSSETRTAQEQLTPEMRRSMLRAFADRMLLKISAMDEPEDMPGAERAVRVAAAIERIYSRCDRAEKHAPDPARIKAERARAAKDAITEQVQLASIRQWGEQSRKDLGTAWDEAEKLIQPQPAIAPANLPPVYYTDLTETIEQALASGLRVSRNRAPASPP